MSDRHETIQLQQYPAPIIPPVVVQTSEPRSVRFRDRDSVRSASRSLSSPRHAGHYNTNATISDGWYERPHRGYGDSHVRAYSPSRVIIIPPRSRARSRSRSRSRSPRSRSRSPVNYSRSHRQHRSHGDPGNSYRSHAYSPMPIIVPPARHSRSRSRSPVNYSRSHRQHRSHGDPGNSYMSHAYSPMPIIIPPDRHSRSRSRSYSISPDGYSHSRRRHRSRSSSRSPSRRHSYQYSYGPPIQIPPYFEPYPESGRQPQGMAPMQPGVVGGNGYAAVNPYQASVAYSMRHTDSSTSSLAPQPGYKPELKTPPLTSYMYAFLTDTIPRQVYLHLLLRLPGLYFSRVSRIFTDAQISLPVIQKMVAETDIAVQDITRHFPPHVYQAYAPISNLRHTWESFIDSVLREWKTFNLVSVLLLSAILTILQINSAASDPITRFSALISLICALMSLLYGGLYIIAFGRMKRTYKAALWAEEAQKSKTSILWNVWVLLAMPAIWLSWSLVSYLVCIMAFVWRTGTIQELETPVMSSKAALPPRIIISGILAIGLIYFSLALDTFRRYGDVMDREWHTRVKEWRNPQGNPPIMLPPPQIRNYSPIYVTTRSPSRSSRRRSRSPRRSHSFIRTSRSEPRSHSPIIIEPGRTIIVEPGSEPSSPSGVPGPPVIYSRSRSSSPPRHPPPVIYSRSRSSSPPRHPPPVIYSRPSPPSPSRPTPVIYSRSSPPSPSRHFPLIYSRPSPPSPSRHPPLIYSRPSPPSPSRPTPVIYSRSSPLSPSHPGFPPVIVHQPSPPPLPHARNHGHDHGDQSNQNLQWPPPSNIIHIESPRPIKREDFALSQPEPPEATMRGPSSSSNSPTSNLPLHPPEPQPCATPSRHDEEIWPYAPANAPFVPLRVGRLNPGSAEWSFYDHPDLFLLDDISVKWQQFINEILAAWTGEHPLLRGPRGDEFKNLLNGGICLPKDALCHILEDWDECFFKQRHLHPFICEEYSSDSADPHTLWVYLLKDPANASVHTLASEDVVEAGGDMSVHHLVWIAPREYLASRKARNKPLLSIRVDFVHS